MAAVVATQRGQVRGREQAGVHCFLGIPFAQPPVGELRFAAPVEPEPWRGERDATRFGPAAIQSSVPGGIGELIGISAGPTAEDCLYLNVWTPGLRGARPVLVWVHGGANLVGSGSQPRIWGEQLARRGDVVVVTINYRLGALGFLYVPELGASGNQALLDQVAALRWVRREIAAFGGDPENVTVFGQSAGGFDIAQLMSLPAAAGCFDRAVPMSGSLADPIPREEAARTGARFAEHFGGFDALRKADASAILALQVEWTRGGLGGSVRLGPVHDGDVLREHPAAGIGRGDHTRGMPLLIGTTRDEFALFTAQSESMQQMSPERLLELAKSTLGDAGERVVACYREARAARGEPVAPVAIWNALLTDQRFRMPAIRTAELHSTHTAATWMYRFDHASPALGGRLGACHSLDIPFIFGSYGIESMRGFCGLGPDVEHLSAHMMDTYLAFARHGDPASAGLPAWPAYDAGARTTMHLAELCFAENAPQDAERRLWASLTA